MAYLTKDQIIGADDRTWRDVEVPEWPDGDGKPGVVRVVSLSAADRDSYEAAMTTMRPDEHGGASPVQDLSNVRAKLAVRCIVDDKSERIFGDHEASRLGQKSAAALDRIFNAAAELSGMTQKSQDEIAGNSDAAPGGDSSSD